MYDLYLDMMAYYVPEDPNQRATNHNIYKLIVESQLMNEMKQGLAALTADPEVTDIQNRLTQADQTILRHKETSAPGAPMYGTGHMNMY